MQNPKPFMKGYRTIFFGWVAGLLPLLTLAGFQFDKTAVLAALAQYYDAVSVLVSGAYLLLGWLVQRYRKRATP